LETVVIDVRPGLTSDSQSGLQQLRPRIWGSLHRPPHARVAAVLIHPTSNFAGHYLLEPLANRGIAALGLNTRYAGNDVALLLERAIQDLGAGVRWLRNAGFERVVLVGNSGGAALVSLYQAQAEALDITATPAGDPIDLCAEDLPSAQGIALTAAHQGRSYLLESWIDPAVVDERDVLSNDPRLDMFNPDNGPPYAQDFIAAYRAAQKQRVSRIEHWVRAKLRQVRAANSAIRDMAFVVHRTLADPRCLDAELDRNDRTPGTSVWGIPFEQNYSANSMGRYTSLTAFLSQWASCSRGDGPACLARTTLPVLIAEHTADSSTFPSDMAAWRRAAGPRASTIRLVGGTHYLNGQPTLITQLADEIAAFARRV
jgi:pimeloyl-ACP methyl ester carboxylesterase